MYIIGLILIYLGGVIMGIAIARIFQETKPYCSRCWARGKSSSPW